MIVAAIDEALKRRGKSRAWLLRRLGYKPPFGSQYDFFNTDTRSKRMVEHAFRVLDIRLIVSRKTEE